LFAEDVELDFV